MRRKGFWVVDEDEMMVLHAMRVDDGAEAYVKLVECEKVVREQCYNISANR